MADEEGEEPAEGEEIEGGGEEGDEGAEDAEPMADEAEQTATPQTAEAGTSERFSINKVAIRKSKYPTRGKELDAYFLTSLPCLSSKEADYSPMPYVFRVPTLSSPVKISNLKSKCPPMYVLLDHTIAVLWLLFTDNEYDCPLGISQLQWAMSFLRTVKTRNGDYPKDIQIAVEAIEGVLISNYAQLSSEMANITRLDDAVKYADGAFGSSQMVSQELPFSVCYAEMFEKCPLTAAGAAQARSMTSVEAQQELENIKTAAGVDSIEKLDSVSKEKAINVLRLWKTDQIEKIKDELRRLRNIEDNLKDIDTNFEGYIEENLNMLTADL